MNTYKIKFIFPFVILFALLGLLWRELFYSTPNELPSALIGEEVPAFQLPALLSNKKIFSEKDLLQLHHVVLLNVWATWCFACNIEAPMLMKIKNQYHVPIYSIDYKDDAAVAQNWLQKYGNPYLITGDDRQGDVAIDLGVYGTPETFIISPAGKIVYRHIGAIDQHSWDEVLYPLIKRYNN